MYKLLIGHYSAVKCLADMSNQFGPIRTNFGDSIMANMLCVSVTTAHL